MGSADTMPLIIQKPYYENNANGEDYQYSTYLKILPCNDQIKELQTILRDK